MTEWTLIFGIIYERSKYTALFPEAKNCFYALNSFIFLMNMERGAQTLIYIHSCIRDHL